MFVCVRQMLTLGCVQYRSNILVCECVSGWAKVLEHCENVLYLDVTLFTVRKIRS